MTEAPTLKQRLTRPLIAGAVTGLIYAILLRGVVNHGSEFGNVMTLSFLFLSPLVLGFLTVRPHPRPSWSYRLFAPWLPAAASLMFFFVVGWEGAICIVMALPIMLPLASIGGILGAIPALRRPSAGVAAAALPLVLMPLERGIPAPLGVHRLETAIAIQAAPAAVWEQIVEVPAITEVERRPALFTRMGFPRPVSATIDRRAVGGVRRARFERGVLFLETVTHFEPGHRLRFTIAAQTDSIPPSTLDPHVTIGGPYFDVLAGEYTIEPRPQGGVVLHLASELRVTTHFNFYSRLWVDAIMRSIQENILEVVRARAERDERGRLGARSRSGGQKHLGADYRPVVTCRTPSAFDPSQRADHLLPRRDPVWAAEDWPPRSWWRFASSRRSPRSRVRRAKRRTPLPPSTPSSGAATWSRS